MPSGGFVSANQAPRDAMWTDSFVLGARYFPASPLLLLRSVPETQTYC